MITIQAALLAARARIDAQEATLLMQAVLDWPSWQLLAQGETRLTDQQEKQFNAWLEQRAAGVPVAYLLRHQPFWTLDLEVSEDTLIPRSDTERLVEVALAAMPASTQCSVIDLGTGSGAIALALKSERPHWRLIAIDQSEAALVVAKRNAQRHALAVDWLHGDWLTAYPGERVDLIVSNPPYIAPDDEALIGDIRYEPRSALVADKQGLADYERILTQAIDVLLPEGRVIFEHGYQQAADLKTLADSLGWGWCQTYQDLAGHPRVSVFKKRVN